MKSSPVGGVIFDIMVYSDITATDLLEGSKMSNSNHHNRLLSVTETLGMLGVDKRTLEDVTRNIQARADKRRKENAGK